MNNEDTTSEMPPYAPFTPPPTTTARPDEAAALAAYSRYYTGLNPAGFVAFKVGYDEAMKDAAAQLSASQGEAERLRGALRQIEQRAANTFCGDINGLNVVRDIAIAALSAASGANRGGA